jgi:hypothetical protein
MTHTYKDAAIHQDFSQFSSQMIMDKRHWLALGFQTEMTHLILSPL